MAKKKYLKLEYMVTLVVFFVVLLSLIPIDIESTVQANFISRWKDKYSRLEYMFNVINAHVDEDLLKSFKHARTEEEREQILITVIKPYLRLNKGKLPRRYSMKFLNKTKVAKTDRYYFEDIYFSENGMIVGIKDLVDKPHEPKFIMMLDINGILPPNTWGKDIYGIEIYEGNIEPFGAGLSMDKLHNDCSRAGTGVACSYYYNIGGGFDD